MGPESKAIIDTFLISDISGFVPEGTGEHFHPHVTTGVASKTYVGPRLAASFEPFTHMDFHFL